jgi:hypothetical protein
VKKVLPAAAAIIGLALVAWQIRSVGLGEVVEGFRAVGPMGFAGVLVLSFLRYTVRSVAWVALMTPPEGRPAVPLRSAIGATIGGDALGNLSFLSLLVSEPAKALYVTSHIPADEALGALAAENFFYSISVALIITAGTLTLLATFVLPEAWHNMAMVSLLLMGVILTAAIWLAWKRPGVTRWLRAHDRSAVGRLVGRLQDLERITYRGLRASPWRLGLVVACQVLFHVLSLLESWWTLHLLTGPTATLLNAFLFDTLNRVINVAFRLVPLRVGVDEVSASELSGLIGLGGATGLTMALVRKLRVLTWVAVGLAYVSRRAVTRR